MASRQASIFKFAKRLDEFTPEQIAAKVAFEEKRKEEWAVAAEWAVATAKIDHCLGDSP